MSHLISDPNRIQIVVCDSEIGDLKWLNRSNCSRDAPVLHPFADPNCYEKFSKREAHLNTLAFEEAIALAAMYCSEQTEQRRLHIMTCLMMGALGRKKKLSSTNALPSIVKIVWRQKQPGSGLKCIRRNKVRIRTRNKLSSR